MHGESHMTFGETIMLNALRSSKTMTAVTLALALSPGLGAWAQPAPAAAPSFPPGPDYAGVYGSHAENEPPSFLVHAFLESGQVITHVQPV